MKKITLRLSLVLAVMLTFMACKKELSLENGGFGGTAQGELVDSLGNCKQADVNGTYSIDTPLVITKNFVNIQVNFTAQGKYKIYTDTVNGMWFIDSGFAISTGVTTVKLKGYGTPILPKTSDFAVYFNNNLCTFAVAVSGSGGSGSGISTGTNDDYFPTTTNSHWVYDYIPKIGNIDTFSVNVISPEIQVDSLSYAQFATRLGDIFYFAKDRSRGIYYAYSTVDFDYTLIFDSIPTSFITYPFLKENAAIGETWSSPSQAGYRIGTNKGTAKAVFTMEQKGIQYSIGGKQYSDVIKVKREIMFLPDTGATTYSTVLTGNAYYAKGYGLIDQVLDTPNRTSTSQTVSLFETPVIK